MIPLISLAFKLDPNNFRSAFLVPETYHHLFQNLEDILCLDIDRNRMGHLLKPEMMAINRFKPNVIVDDLNYSAFSSRIMRIPRISIVRRGILPFETHTDGYRHSSDIIEYFKELNGADISGLTDWKPKTVSDLFQGDVNIIPSIPSVEALPIGIKNQERYIYAGPLLIPDVTTDTFMEIYKEVYIFIKKQSDKRIVYFNVGMAFPEALLKKAERCIRSLLNIPDVVLITNIPVKYFRNVYDEDRCISGKFLPMTLICSSADLMIHQCGSGTYNYQLKYEVPAIILGTRYYDRDDIAIQLETIGAASYISEDLEEIEYFNRFDQLLKKLLDHSSPE